jgi:hypothetical protein
MANAFYDYFLTNLLKKTTTTPDFDTVTLKWAPIDHGTDTPNVASDDFYNDISAGLVGALSDALASVTVGVVAAGVVDAADDSPAWTALSGSSIESINLINDSGAGATSDLIIYVDTATGLPLTPNGGDVNIAYNASGIFKI